MLFRAFLARAYFPFRLRLWYRSTVASTRITSAAGCAWDVEMLIADFYPTVPPDISDDSTSTDMVVREGSNVSLRCEATGSPKPNITWRREDGELISLGKNLEGKLLTSCHNSPENEKA